jgi:hypothetical protein
MDIKIGDALVTKDGVTAFAEGKVMAIGDRKVVVYITKTSDFSAPLEEGSLYEVWEEWFSETGFYRKKVVPTGFELGATYKYKNNGWNSDKVTYRVTELVHLDNPDAEGQNDVAVMIGTYKSGGQFVEIFEPHEFEDMVKQ